MERMMKQDGGFRPRLQIVEIEGHGRAFEVYDSGVFRGTFDRTDGTLVGGSAPYRIEGVTLGSLYGGRVAEVYGFKAYEAACAKVIEADPEGWDCSDVMPEPFLVVVRRVAR